MSTDTEYGQRNVDFNVLEENLEDLHTSLTNVERRQLDNEAKFQEKIQHVNSRVAVLSARVGEFERSHNAADEMQSQVHEMREDLDRLKGRVDKLKQNVKYQMAASLKDMQDSLDELDRTITTFRQEIGLKVSRKSALLQEYFQWGEKNISDITAWKAAYEGRVHVLEQEFSRVKRNQAHLCDFYETACNDIVKLHKTIDELQQCTPDHSDLSEGLKEMKLLFSSLQDKIEELGTEIAWTQMVAPSLQNGLCGVVSHETAKITEMRNLVLNGFVNVHGFLVGVLLVSLQAAVHGLGNRLSALASQGWSSLTLLSATANRIPRIPVAMRRSTLLWLLVAGVFVFGGLYVRIKRPDFTELERPVWHALRHRQLPPASFDPSF